jgi:hypothetical protein
MGDWEKLAMEGVIVFRLINFILFIFVSVFSAMAAAQATRTWVSGVGDDANPCSRTAPCKTFAGAISKTAVGGEINCIDPGGYGAVTITKSITIDCGGTFGSILAAGTNGVTINISVAGANDVVILRNLAINGAGAGGGSPPLNITGLSGINFLAGKHLHVENVTIQGFLNQGINFSPSSGLSSLSVTNTSVRDVLTNGILVQTTGAAEAHAVLDRVWLQGNGTGLRVDANSNVVITGSSASNNALNGILAVSGLARVFVEDTGASFNQAIGIKADGATVRISNTTVTRNNTGLHVTNGGTIVSHGNNRVSGNTAANGAPSSTIGQI